MAWSMQLPPARTLRARPSPAHAHASRAAWRNSRSKTASICPKASCVRSALSSRSSAQNVSTGLPATQRPELTKGSFHTHSASAYDKAKLEEHACRYPPIVYPRRLKCWAHSTDARGMPRFCMPQNEQREPFGKTDKTRWHCRATWAGVATPQQDVDQGCSLGAHATPKDDSLQFSAVGTACAACARS
eukprot:6184559-Pleurochrysis_carterae.AAC.9